MEPLSLDLALARAFVNMLDPTSACSMTPRVAGSAPESHPLAEFVIVVKSFISEMKHLKSSIPGTVVPATCRIVSGSVAKADRDRDM